MEMKKSLQQFFPLSAAKIHGLLHPPKANLRYFRVLFQSLQLPSTQYESAPKPHVPGSSDVGFVVDKVALGQVSSEYFGFPCQSSFHQFLHNHHHLSSGTGTIGQ
jgi:hypothetical protein